MTCLYRAPDRDEGVYEVFTNRSEELSNPLIGSAMRGEADAVVEVYSVPPTVANVPSPVNNLAIHTPCFRLFAVAVIQMQCLGAKGSIPPPLSLPMDSVLLVLLSSSRTHLVLSVLLFAECALNVKRFVFSTDTPPTH